MLIDSCTRLSLDTLNQAINQLPKQLMTKVADAEFRLDQFCVKMVTAATSLHVQVKSWAKSMHICQIQQSVNTYAN